MGASMRHGGYSPLASSMLQPSWLRGWFKQPEPCSVAVGCIASSRSSGGVLQRSSRLASSRAAGARGSPMPKGQKMCRVKSKDTECGHPNGSNAKQCSKCKTPFPVSTSTQRCPGCAASLNINSRTCTYCAFFPLEGEVSSASQVGIRKKSISKKVGANANNVVNKSKPAAKAERRTRERAGCAPAEGSGAVSLDQPKKQCEGCGLKRPSYGLPAERKKRWCSGCAAAEGNGAVSLQDRKMCEGCGLKVPHYGLPAERKARWCGGCAAAEGSGAVRLGKDKMCEGCGLKQPSYGLPGERRKRWCAGCAKKSHPGAVSSSQKGPTASAPRPRAPAKTRPSKRHKVTTMPTEQLAPPPFGSTAVAGGDDGGSDGEEAEALRPAAQPLNLGAKPSTGRHFRFRA